MEQVSPPTKGNVSKGSDISKGSDKTKSNQEQKRRVVTMEPSVHTFAGNSSSRRDRSDPVMITDALADVRVK
jgi:hypothetical protein